MSNARLPTAATDQQVDLALTLISGQCPDILAEWSNRERLDQDAADIRSTVLQLLLTVPEISQDHSLANNLLWKLRQECRRRAGLSV